MTTPRLRRMPGLALGALLLLLAAGCLQIETRVKVNEDGSAVITERVQFSRQLLDLAGDKKPELLRLLSREGVLERMKQMGQGLALARHEFRDAGGAKESWAEFTVDDVNKFQYVSPWLAYGDYPENSVVKCEYDSGLHRTSKTCRNDGRELSAREESTGSSPAAEGRAGSAGPDAPGPPGVSRPGPDYAGYVERSSPEVLLRVVCARPLRVGRSRRESGATVVDLLDISDANMDKWGGAFLENEEVMLELAQLQFEGPNVVQNVQGYWSNETLPVFFPAGSPSMWYSGGPHICFAPSRQLFDKHFAGKKLDPRGMAEVRREAGSGGVRQDRMAETKDTG